MFPGRHKKNFRSDKKRFKKDKKEKNLHYRGLEGIQAVIFLLYFALNLPSAHYGVGKIKYNF